MGLLFALALWVGPHIPGRWAFVVPSLVALLLHFLVLAVVHRWGVLCAGSHRSDWMDEDW